jgi:hypothetical protein
MQGWIERAVLDLQDIFGATLDGMRDGMAVRWSQNERPEHEQIEGALEKIPVRAIALPRSR